MPDKPIPKPKQFLNTLDLLHSKAAANTLSPKTYADLVGQFAQKAYKNDELSFREYMNIVKPLFGRVGEMVTEKIKKYEDMDNYAQGGRVNFLKGGDTSYNKMVTEMYIKAGGQEGTGMDIDTFAEKYFKKFATGGRVKYSEGSDEPDVSKLREKIIELMDKEHLTFEEAYKEAREAGYAAGGRVGLQGGKLAQLGNIVDVKNIPYYASKTVEGAVNAGEVLSKLPFAASNLVSRLLREKPSKEMFLSALNDIQPGSFAEAIGLSDVIARQEENLSPEVKTAGSQLSLTSETFIPVGAAINLGNKIVKTASTKLGKDGPKLEKLIDEKLTARGEGRRDFNKMVATTGLFAALKALGITGLAGKAATKVDDIKINLKQDLDGWYEDETLTGVENLFTTFEPLTKRGEELLKKLKVNKDADGSYFISDSDEALDVIENLKKDTDNLLLETDVRIPKKGERVMDTPTTLKTYKVGDKPEDVFNESYGLIDDYRSSYTNKLEFINPNTEQIINTILKPKVKKASGGRVRYGDGSKPMTKSERWMRDYFFSGKGGYDDRMSYQEFAMGPGQELFKRFNKKNGGVIYGKYAKQILSS